MNITKRQIVNASNALRWTQAAKDWGIARNAPNRMQVDSSGLLETEKNSIKMYNWLTILFEI